eukprot:1011343-Amphidinium_carterae.1
MYQHIGAQQEFRFGLQDKVETVKVPYHKLWKAAPEYDHLSVSVDLRAIADWIVERQQGFPLPDLWQVKAECLRRQGAHWQRCHLGVGGRMRHDDKEMKIEVLLPGSKHYVDRLDSLSQEAYFEGEVTHKQKQSQGSLEEVEAHLPTMGYKSNKYDK